ncbi:CD3072 family TudS-related putative desulfidase [Vibrio salinus]|uniref:CD3072 family TudS-related putative desulfidase n=1 Tax=Vibrio salinus TaxID=2899784 RepID=UPI001E521DF3|nr:CD3072 family TudS-related putative desulfidase [Vibrio salinus]MCE0495051.1 2-thiouracil desulfurase family protein [Vibrio salinus]
MFEDNRSKKLVLVSHCLLNQNSISDGTADYPGIFSEVMNKLAEYHVGIIQMPCPELMCLGLDRGDVDGGNRSVLEENSRIRKQLLTESSQKKIRTLVDNVFFQISEYLKNGFIVQGMIGVNRSPSCGVNSTSANNQEIEGRGVFIQSLMDKFAQEGIHIPVIGVKTFMPEAALKEVDSLLS